MRLSWLGLLAALGACNGGAADDTGKTTGDDTAVDTDADDDGSPAGEDCDDGDASVYPGAPDEWYDDVDSDCAGDDDFDQDGDGVRGGDGNPDCDDTVATTFPGADETCNGVDDDCDDGIDEDATDGQPVYVDADGDTFGDGDPQGSYCDAPVGTSFVDGDCDDTLQGVNPGAAEVCDGLDNDCSGFSDDEPTDGATWYADFDGDGYGDAATSAITCAQPEGYVADATDCDDVDAASYPGATEVCDLEDNDCDGTPDDGATDPRTYYQDADGDGYGDSAVSATGCGAPTGYVEADGDCDDADAAKSPGATELCNGADDDCDGEVDSDSPDAVAYHPDVDGDGYGDADTVSSSCSPVSGWIEDGSDCDDGDATAYPGGTEVCDGGDDDCDGATDESDAVDAATWYIDADNDDYGDPSVVATACDAPVGYADNADDCDDTLAESNPGTRESCDGIDNDCDTETDEDDAYDATTWYADDDLDGYGDPDTSSTSCDAPPGYVANGGDCDDGDADRVPGAAETQDLLDEDCDGYVDEDFISAGDIVVTEVARQTYTGGTGLSTNAQAQWFEVYNTTTFDVEMSNWYVEEDYGDSFFVHEDAGVVVPAGGYAVFCYDDQWFADPTDCDYTWGDSGWGTGFYDSTYYFDRDHDLVVVYMGGTLMDQVEWSTTAESDGDTWPRTAKYAMEADDGALDASLNDDAGAWCLASSSDVYSLSGSTGHPDYGTPGEANGSCD
ncbi:MAG: MopE-related protein [Myxococcota bacterium]